MLLKGELRDVVGRFRQAGSASASDFSAEKAKNKCWSSNWSPTIGEIVSLDETRWLVIFIFEEGGKRPASSLCLPERGFVRFDTGKLPRAAGAGLQNDILGGNRVPASLGRREYAELRDPGDEMRCIEEEKLEFRERKGSRMSRIMALVPLSFSRSSASANSSVSLALVISIISYLHHAKSRNSANSCITGRYTKHVDVTRNSVATDGSVLAMHRSVLEISCDFAQQHSSPNGGPASNPLAPSSTYKTFFREHGTFAYLAGLLGT
jgi:hypothetical protein